MLAVDPVVMEEPEEEGVRAEGLLRHEEINVWYRDSCNIRGRLPRQWGKKHQEGPSKVGIHVERGGHL